ncbi:hypothetical protein BH09ACT1_BH09ACT1_21950 [soil metagenome]
MVRRSSLTIIAAALALAALSLVGCASSLSPSADPSSSVTPSSPSPSVSPAPVAARIQINGSDLAVLDAEGAAIASLPYSDDLMTTVASLEALLSEKAIHTAIAKTDCNYAEDSYAWGLGLRVSTPPFPDSVETKFFVASYASSVGGVRVGTPGGFGVGDPFSALIPGIPGSTVEGASDGTVVWYDLDSDKTGAFAGASTLHGPISIISAPWSTGDSDC